MTTRKRSTKKKATPKRKSHSKPRTKRTVEVPEELKEMLTAGPRAINNVDRWFMKQDADTKALFEAICLFWLEQRREGQGRSAKVLLRGLRNQFAELGFSHGEESLKNFISAKWSKEWAAAEKGARNA